MGICGRRVTRNSSYCQGHLCEASECSQPRHLPFRYCNAHKCAVNECQHQRMGTGINPWGYAVHHGSSFCRAHTCTQEGCQARTGPDSVWCLNHMKCRITGCSRTADAGGRETTCCSQHQPAAEPPQPQQVHHVPHFPQMAHVPQVPQYGAVPGMVYPAAAGVVPHPVQVHPPPLQPQPQPQQFGHMPAVPGVPWGGPHWSPGVQMAYYAPYRY